MRFFTIVAPGLAFVSGVFSATNAGLQAYIGGTLSKDNHYGAPIPPWKQGCYPGWYFGNHHDWTGGYVPWLKDEHLCGWLEQIPWCLKCPNHPPPPPPPSPPPPSPPPPGPPPPPHYPPHYPPHSPPPPPHSSPPPPHSPPPPPHSPPSPPHSPPHPPYYGFKEVFDGYDGAVQAGDYLTFGLVDTVEDCRDMCDSVAGCNFFNTYYDINGKDDSPLLTCALFEDCHTKEEATNKGGQNQIGDGKLNYIKDSAGYCRVY